MKEEYDDEPQQMLGIDSTPQSAACTSSSSGCTSSASSGSPGAIDLAPAQELIDLLIERGGLSRTESTLLSCLTSLLPELEQQSRTIAELTTELDMLKAELQDYRKQVTSSRDKGAEEAADEPAVSSRRKLTAESLANASMIKNGSTGSLLCKREIVEEAEMEAENGGNQNSGSSQINNSSSEEMAEEPLPPPAKKRRRMGLEERENELKLLPLLAPNCNSSIFENIDPADGTPATTTSSRRPRIEYREIRRFTSEDSFDQWLKTTHWTRAHKSRGPNHFYICKFSQRKGYECKASLRVVRHAARASCSSSSYVIRVEESADQWHTHEPKGGVQQLDGPRKLTAEVKRIVREQLEDGKTAEQMRNHFRDLYRYNLQAVPTLLQIQNLVQRLRKGVQAR